MDVDEGIKNALSDVFLMMVAQAQVLE